MSNTTVSSVSRTRRIALTVLGAATVAAGGLALAPHAGAAENPTKTPPAAVAPATTQGGDTMHADTRTKGFVVKNDTGKHLHVANVKHEYPWDVFEKTYANGTDLAPGADQRWEMLWQWDAYSGYNAWVTYADDDGSQITITMHQNVSNTGEVGPVTTPPGAKPLNYKTGYDYDTSAHTITIGK